MLDQPNIESFDVLFLVLYLGAEIEINKLLSSSLHVLLDAECFSQEVWQSLQIEINKRMLEMHVQLKFISK